MKRTIATALWLGLSAGLAVSSPLAAGEAGDAVFAERGPWSVEPEGLRWSVHVDGPEAAGFLHVEDGSVTLNEITDPSDKKPALQLTQKTDSRTRKIGPFPISGGDPVLTFFLEQTTRDVAKLTGGSPYYIRNRMKDALFRGGKISQDGSTASFQPFEGDPNAAQMRGFETLTLTFVLAQDPKSPIRELLAQTEGDEPGYVNRMVLQ
ncbi:hypothetical protein [Paracoccus alkanivorans]|uniref:Uncharacterized protein n=1 Tax=Paracoccus alkanivorans TaxID=2116655 RepID=A0A3M0M2K3_9RHOB|nr:hypothetical protein [Paracoccus alkanivorans]RMC32002.1 hypothetical protein C9E81_19200 [Paracoccus alkanivorans]